jgi:hypothetical protein
MLAQLKLADGQPGAAEATIRQALNEAPEDMPRQRLVEVLDASLRAQDRGTAADQCWTEYGVPRPTD